MAQVDRQAEVGMSLADAPGHHGVSRGPSRDFFSIALSKVSERWSGGSLWPAPRRRRRARRATWSPGRGPAAGVPRRARIPGRRSWPSSASYARRPGRCSAPVSPPRPPGVLVQGAVSLFISTPGWAPNPGRCGPCPRSRVPSGAPGNSDRGGSPQHLEEGVGGQALDAGQDIVIAGHGLGVHHEVDEADLHVGVPRGIQRSVLPATCSATDGDPAV